jgi:hypothetical protein
MPIFVLIILPLKRRRFWGLEIAVIRASWIDNCRFIDRSWRTDSSLISWSDFKWTVESLRYGQLSTIASDIARRTIGYTIQ